MRRILRDSQNVYINGERLRGVSSCSVSKTSSEQALSSVQGFAGWSLGGAEALSFDVIQNIISTHDPIPELFGETNVNGELFYESSSGNKSIGFGQGYIKSYSISCEVGSAPQISYSIQAYSDDPGDVSAQDGGGHEGDIWVARPGFLDMNVDGRQTNAFQSFSLSMDLDVSPKLITGQTLPSKFYLKTPIAVSCEFSLILNDKNVPSLINSICDSSDTQSFEFTFHNNCSVEEVEIRKFFLPYAKIQDVSVDASESDALTANMSYKSNILSIDELKKVFTGVEF